ncbi:MAG: HAMP domain-containing histidine kinase [Polyangiaceae bacterium]|nr:HAMP domain-containing histidine kinase [Polyangiaceae bacterium]MCK6531376.1 HAMP domain-containing histidine kinase [Polyangiaceae bacterium]
MSRARGTLSGTSARLSAAFFAVLALFGAALWIALSTFDRLGAAEAEVAGLEDAKHAGHAVAAAIREQYIHQAHTIINWDRSHLGHYEDAAKSTRSATRQLHEMARGEAHRQRTLEIARLVAEVDEAFKARVIPGVDANDREAVRRGHEATERLVGTVVAKSEGLNRELERFSMEARERERSMRERARWAFIGCFVLAIGVAGVLGFVMVRSIRGRLERLGAGATSIAKGDLSTRIRLEGDDEFSDLADAFNQMAADLRSHQDAAVRSQKLATVGQIAAGVAHEINNPLGVILGYLKLMRRNADLTRLAGDELRIVEDEAHQCQRIVRELLDLARPPQFERTPLNLFELVKESVDRLGESGAVTQGIQVECSGAPLVRGDPVQLREVVANLLNNALEAGSERVEVHVAGNQSTVCLEVKDTGTGMDGAAREHAFDPFFTTKPRGTGLGLAISQAIVHAHGGAIAIDSALEDGTRVRVELPVASRSLEAGA